MNVVLLAVFLAIADAALAFAYGSPIAWALMAIPVAAIFVRAPRSPRVSTALTWVSRVLIIVVAVRGDVVGLQAGMALVLLAGLFLMDDRAFPTGRTFLPAAFGVFLAAASTGTAPYFVPLAWAATGVIAVWLLTIESPSPSTGSGRAGRVEALKMSGVIVAFAIPCIVVAQGLIMFLPWAQPKVEQAAADFMDPNAAATGLSIGAQLGDVEKLAKSKRVVLRMWSEQPAYLRAGVYTQFDGRAWSAPRMKTTPRVLAPARQTAPAFVDAVPGEWRAVSDSRPQPRDPSTSSFARFVVAEHAIGILPAPSSVDAVRTTGSPMTIDPYELVHAPPRPPASYAIRYAPGPVPLRAGDDEVMQRCLQIPERIDPRIRELAQQLGPDTASVQEKIARTLSHVQRRCRYSLDVGAFRTNDPVAEFLFDKKQGYCEYLATSTILLLRLQGVAARYVNGLNVQDTGRRGDHFVVRASDAHAWAEALVPDVGWVQVDATPPGDYAAVHAESPSFVEHALEAMKSRWADVIGQVRQGGWPVVAALLMKGGRYLLLLGLGAIVVAIVIRRLRRPRRADRAAAMRPRAVPGSLSPELAECFHALEGVWARAGYPRPPHRAPLEHVAALPPDRVPTELRTLSLEVIQCFYRGAYGGEEIAPAEIVRLSQATDAAGRSLSVESRPDTPRRS